MKIWSKLFGTKCDISDQRRSEDLYKTQITDTYVKVTHPGREDEQINWDEIEYVKLVNTDEGPFLPDVWLILLGNGKGCSVPQGSEGWTKVYEVVSKYEGFNFERVIESAGCTDNKIFDLWKR